MNLIKYTLGVLFLFSYCSSAIAHGWSEYPEARQSICYSQGGIWSGSPPNPACSQAKDISGSYPFVQQNEFSINIADFNNIDTVKSAIPDGTLCYANDPQKKGMGAPHTGWARTKMKAGTFEYIFNATAPHNPSFWQFYLTKAGADLSKGLAWGDLELIASFGNVPVNNGKYTMDVTLPHDRVGDAILFVRWQRDDPVGEGFYNCSDITIGNSGGIEPDPEPVPQQNLVQGSQFIPSDFGIPEVGDTVEYDIINKLGNVARTFNIKIDQTNLNDWARLLASDINGWHEKNKNGAVFIGSWHEEMNHYMYFQHEPALNFINTIDARASGLMTLRRGNNVAGNLDAKVFELTQSDNSVKAGEKVIFAFNETVSVVQTLGTDVEVSQAGSYVIVDTKNITSNETLTFLVTAQLSLKEVELAIEVNVDDIATSLNTWDASKTYLGGEIVTFNGRDWEAQWWVRGGNSPEDVYSNNVWGVWRPTN